MVDFLAQQGQLMLTGIIVTFISGFIYKMTPTGFKCAGRYRKKETAVFIYLGAAFLLGITTPFVHVFSSLIIEFVPALTIIGFFVLSANFIVNQKIRTWRQTAPKTLIIYVVSILLMILGVLLIA